jgi:hypothetical protein
MKTIRLLEVCSLRRLAAYCWQRKLVRPQTRPGERLTQMRMDIAHVESTQKTETRPRTSLRGQQLATECIHGSFRLHARRSTAKGKEGTEDGASAHVQTKSKRHR